MPDELNMISTHVVGVFETRSTPLDNPALNLNDPKTWEAVFGDAYSTDAGISVTKKKALEVAPFWQAVLLIAGDCGMIPLAPYRQRQDFDRTFWEESPQHWTYSLTRIQANEVETSQDYFERLMADALVWGDGWGLVSRDMSNRASELFHLLPDRTGWERVDGELWCVSEINGKLEVFPSDDVIHISGLKPLGGEIPDFVQQSRNTIAAYLSSTSFISKYFKNGGRVGGLLELPREMPKPTQQVVEEGFRKSYEGGENAFKTVILRDNAKFHAAQTSPKDVESVDSTERLARDVARFFNLPASMLNVEGTSSYNSKSQDQTGYVTHCLNRWLKKIQGQCRLKLLPARERASIEFRHDTDELFTMDMESRMRAYSTGIACKVLNPNDGRLEEGKPPYEGGNEFANPNTSSPVAPAAAVEPQQPDPPQRKSIGVDAKRSVVTCGMTARHKAKSPTAFEDFVNKMPLAEPWQVDLRAAFNVVIDSVAADQLAAAVDAVCAKYEQIYLEG